MRCFAALCLPSTTLLLFGLSFPVTAALWLNEVLYDPPGSDGASEFVELYANERTPLDGVELWFLNGSDPDPPRVVWRATRGVTLAAGDWWVVGEEAVVARDETARLDLQNGPDALWLVRDGEVLDRVAWGGAPELGEGAAAIDVSGRSLGRVPDGRDTDDNAADWHSLDAPTPGGANRSPVEFALVSASLDPPWSAAPAPATFEFWLVARGHAASQGGAWTCCGSTLRRPFILAAGDTLRVREPLVLRGGRDQVVIEIWSDASDPVVRATIPIATGPGDVALNEIMPRPDSGEPEWLELLSRVDTLVSLEDWSIVDRHGEPHRLGQAAAIPAGGFLILTPDPNALRRTRAVASEVILHRPVGGWPTLNDTSSDPASFADAVGLIDADGVVVDRMQYRAADLDPRGRSLERAQITSDTPSLWLPSPVGASPGAANASARGRVAGRGLRIEPNPFTPDADGSDDVLLVRLRVERAIDTPHAEIRDLSGDRVVTLAGAGTGRFYQWSWNGNDTAGRPVPLGAYVVVVTERGGDDRLQEWKALVAVGRR